MATNAAQRETIARNIMKKGLGVVAIANPRGPAVDAILIKSPNYRPVGAPAGVSVWYEFTGDSAASNYGV